MSIQIVNMRDIGVTRTGSTARTQHMGRKCSLFGHRYHFRPRGSVNLNTRLEDTLPTYALRKTKNIYLESAKNKQIVNFSPHSLENY